MGLKDLYKSTAVTQGYIIPALEKYLIARADRDQDRAFNVNAPSSAGRCLRQRYYSRTDVESDGISDARVQRIFDNGTGFHERTQRYLLDQGILLMDEIPLLDEDLNIQGHTDGLLEIGYGECAIMELKSIKDDGFKSLKEAKPEHKLQGLTYVHCTEKRRLRLHELYPDMDSYIKSETARREYYAKFYQHLKDGRKHTREEKIKFQVDLHISLDDILYGLDKPVDKVVFLYENKNDQSLKEYTIKLDSTTEPLLIEELKKCSYLNECVKNKTTPNREFPKSSFQCRWCDWRNECYPL